MAELDLFGSLSYSFSWGIKLVSTATPCLGGERQANPDIEQESQRVDVPSQLC
jgi:hypothetical protein